MNLMPMMRRLAVSMLPWLVFVPGGNAWGQIAVGGPAQALR